MNFDVLPELGPVGSSLVTILPFNILRLPTNSFDTFRDMSLS